MTSERITVRPLHLGGVRLKNRITAAPMERNYCNPDGHMTDVYKNYLIERAEAGVALVMTEATYVRADGKGRTHQLGAHDDSCIAGLRELADALHENGALVGCELNHGGGTTQSTISGLPSVAPSPIPCAVAGGQVPRELSTVEIHELAADFGKAAARCVEAGIDVLSIHGGHGYLVHQFMSPLGNHRTDEFADPVKFLNLVIEAVRENAPDTPLGVRISVVEGAVGGLDSEQTLEIIARANLEKLDFLDLSAGSYAAGEWIVQSGEWAPGLLSQYASAYRRFGMPLGMAGRLNSPEIIEQVLSDGLADFVSLARALHADPAFATACLEGVPYRPCIACNVCIDTLGVGPVGCSVNPTVGRGRTPVPTPMVRPGAKVIVVGAGPAGLTAARELARAGAQITIVDGEHEVGGQMAAAARMKSTPDFHRFLDWSLEEFERLGVSVQLGTEADAATVAAAHADAVLIATGGVAPHVSLQSADAMSVMDVREWLNSHDLSEAPTACTIWGADGVGMSVADSLANQRTSVLLIGAEHEIAPDFGRRAKILAIPRLRDNAAVRIHLNTTVKALENGRVLVAREGEEEQWLDAPGPFLISQGIRPRVASRELSDTLGFDGPSTSAGSASRSAPVSIRNAVLSGYDEAQALAAQLA